MKTYNLWNRLVAWLTFVIAAFTYLSTLEPSVSFWDCGEFISSADKLLIGHPPGAPLFMIIGRVFALFAPSSDKVASMINSVSALSSAFTILFLFWSITSLAKRLVSQEGNPSLSQTIAVIGSGFIGSLAYAFTDTFWFSAVEGEVYAMSSLFTAIVFWAILKWEGESDSPHASRWIILIAYLLGLSIGVHLLNLLAIPAIALVYYFKTNDQASFRGFVTTLILSFTILGFIMYGIIPGTVKLAALFDLFFVNSLGFAFNSGVVAFFVLALAGLSFAIYHSYVKRRLLLNTIFTCSLVMLIGYSSFAIVLIRANASPTMNQSCPDDAFSLLNYLNREQYGDKPLIYGQYYSAPLMSFKKAGVQRDQIHGKYVVVTNKSEAQYDDRFKTLFPRMWSPQAQHVEAYKQWAKVKGESLKATNAKTVVKPTYAENLRFFFRYQLGHMYGRYFMWNFVGRQNDQQGHGDLFTGNWISGIGFVDDFLIGGDSAKLPDIIKQDKSRNTYFFLPLILGLLGIVFQFSKMKTQGVQSISIVCVFFILTGIAIVFYLNQPPLQPRERDYAYAASFYAFSIWIGLGLLFAFEQLSRLMKQKYAAPLATALCLSVPTLLVFQNWDDHDRSNRYVARDFAANYLNSCEPNAILFSNGDNDTFPLWYLQEVEGIRTDVRVCNLSYLNTDWYVNQMRKQSYQSAPLPISLTKDDTRLGTNDAVYLIDHTKAAVPMKSAFAWLLSDNPKTNIIQGQKVAHFPSKKLSIGVDKEVVLENELVGISDSNKIVGNIELDYTAKRAINKNNLVVLDLLMTNEWQRPIYYSTGVGKDQYYGLAQYFQMCGMTYQIKPLKSNRAINTEVMYDNMMNKYSYGNVNAESIYLEENSRHQVRMYRQRFIALANELLNEGQQERACAVMRKCMQELPSQAIPYVCASAFENDLPMVDTLFKLDMNAEATVVLDEMHHHVKQDLDYYLTYKDNDPIKDKVQFNLSAYYQICRMYETYLIDGYDKAKFEFQDYYVKVQEKFNI